MCLIGHLQKGVGMGAESIGIIVTAVVGMGGILSTYMVSLGQMKSQARQADLERKRSLRFAQFDLLLRDCSEFLAQLQTLRDQSRVRAAVRDSWRRNLRESLPGLISRLSSETEQETGAGLDRIVERLESEPDFAEKLMPLGEGMPSPVDVDATIRRLSELSARLRITGGNDITSAAKAAASRGIALCLKSAANELSADNESLDFEPLEKAIESFELAAIYELKIRPFDRSKTLGELMAEYEVDRKTRNTDLGD